MPQGEKSEVQLELLVEAMASQRWNPSVDVTCWYRKFGAWIGRPGSYTVESNIGGESAGELEFEPVVAFGLGYSPNSYLSIVAGATYGALAEADDTKHQTWAFTAGIGGNLDIITGLIQ